MSWDVKKRKDDPVAEATVFPRRNEFLSLPLPKRFCEVLFWGRKGKTFLRCPLSVNTSFS